MAKGIFSLIVALYNVENYVDAFFRSIRLQSYPIQDLDIIVVDDGSSDASRSIAESWRSRYPDVIRVFAKSNGGPGSARNVGLSHAKNSWITFCDPDDILHPEYFAEVSHFLESDSNSLSEMLTSRLVEHADGTIRTTNTHPLDWKFRHGNRLVDLDEDPNHVHLSGGTVFLKRSVIEKHGLRFDEEIRPKFEDANFIGLYLSLVPKPIVGIVATARYFYRKRSNGTSLVQGTWSDPRAYDEVPRLGYLGLLQGVQKNLGNVPAWAQSMVLYDLVWMYIADKAMHSGTGTITKELQRLIHTNLDQIMSLIDVETIENFAAVSQGWVFHNILLHHYKTPMEPTPVVINWGDNSSRKTTKFSYMFGGGQPLEEFRVDGRTVVPIAVKTIDHALFGRVLVQERVFTLPLGRAVVYLNGERARLTAKWNVPQRGNFLAKSSLKSELTARPNGSAKVNRSPSSAPARPHLEELTTRAGQAMSKLRLHAMLSQASVPGAALGVARRLAVRKARKLPGRDPIILDQSLIAKAASEPSSSLYRDAWVLMDRIDRADDNAEHLYRYLMHERPDINAWFLLAADSPDWNRLRDEGFRLVAYGSEEAVLLVLNAAYKISSHADRSIQYPIDPDRFGRGDAKIVFLQHGVTKDDLSRWINGKRLSLMITATNAEHRSIVGDQTPYKWSADEVKLTGFPRHDRLRRMANSFPVGQRRTILIAPTWRQYMTEALSRLSSPSEKSAYFESTEYGLNWLALLRSPDLAKLARDNGLAVKFLGHPNLAAIIGLLELPAFVSCVNYSDVRIQDELAESAVVISDFSSLVFDAAFAGSNVVHFQFDGDDIFKGGHVYRKGYFDYQLDGFGPRVTAPDDVVAELLIMAKNAFIRSPTYEERTRATFRFWDSDSSKRVTDAIESLGRPWNYQLPAIKEVRVPK